MNLPHEQKIKNIAYLEMVSSLEAVKVWHVEWAGLNVMTKCDNHVCGFSAY